MRIFALGDPHLSFNNPKPMHIFGEHWRDHEQKIFNAWEKIAQINPDVDPVEDILILAGDISWAMKLHEAQPDLDWIASLHGQKIMIRGNHDFWWDSITKVRSVVGPTIELLQASCVIKNRVAFVGTRGWQCPGNEPSMDFMELAEKSNSVVKKGYTEQDFKIYQREVGRLKLGLEQARQRSTEYDQLIVILHYPPMNADNEQSGFTELIEEYKANWCVYGHLHGESIKTAFNGQLGNTKYQLVSADSINFIPFRIQ